MSIDDNIEVQDKITLKTLYDYRIRNFSHFLVDKIFYF